MIRTYIALILSAALLAGCTEPSSVVPWPDCPDVLEGHLTGLEECADGTWRIQRCVDGFMTWGACGGEAPLSEAGLECMGSGLDGVREASDIRGGRRVELRPLRFEDGGWVACAPGEDGCEYRRWAGRCRPNQSVCEPGAVEHRPCDGLQGLRYQVRSCEQVGEDGIDGTDWGTWSACRSWFDDLEQERCPGAPSFAEVADLVGEPNAGSASRLLDCDEDVDCVDAGDICQWGRCGDPDDGVCVPGTARWVDEPVPGWLPCVREGDEVRTAAWADEPICHSEVGRCRDGAREVLACTISGLEGFQHRFCVGERWQVSPCLPPCREDDWCPVGECHDLTDVLVPACASSDCEPVKACVEPSCENGLRDQDEASVDADGICG